MMNKYIFFIHGYSTNSKKTWGNFIELLKTIPLLDYYKIIALDYNSPSKFYFWKSAPTLYNIAEGLITKINNTSDLENDEIILVGHSNGGVVIKKLLQRLEIKKIKHNITKVCFLDVPHHGSGYATAGMIISPRNKHIKSLQLNSPDLLEINDSWHMLLQDNQLAVLNLVADDEDVVASLSARFNMLDSITIPNTNHGSITQPANIESDVIVELTKFVLNEIPLKKFENRASKSYQDWRRFDRHHTLSYVYDESRKNAFQSLQTTLVGSSPLVRLTGLSGLGKSRLLIEYINLLEIQEEQILVYDASNHEVEILNSIKLAVDQEAKGFIIIENCKVKLHNLIQKLFFNNDVQLKVITINFYHEDVNDTVHIKLEKLQSHEIQSLIRNILPSAEKQLVDKIDKFVEGFPLLVDMLTNQLVEENSITANFTESDLVEKLINGDGNLTEIQRDLLKVFSLFDYFQFQKNKVGEVNEHVDFIIEITNSNQRDFEKTLTQFSQKELINCTGSFARIVPKPLACNLAIAWWNSSLFDSQSNLISKLPSSLLESFCKQITYLDSSLNVQSFVENFCDTSRPFGHAELLLSIKGSRLFRALVEVNPTATSNLLYRVFNSLQDKDISEINGDVRRNLVWALEMLVFHEECFDNSSWCLFKLAQFENEGFSNNALGQFSQLFNWQLSGTEANFGQRLLLLNKIVSLNIQSANIVIIEAIDKALNTFGTTRTIGAEFQGTKPKLEEWRPKLWQDIFDYWKNLFDILVVLSKDPSLIEAIKSAIGNNIRGMISYNLILMIDNAIRNILELSDKYWPEASTSIIHALEFDKKNLTVEAIEALEKWNTLLSPDKANLEEQLKLIVLNPVQDYKYDKNEELIDIGAIEAKKLAKELSISIDTITPFIDLILTFPEQKESWIFGKELSLLSTNYEELLTSIIEYLRNNNKADFQFISGFLEGINEKSSEEWQNLLKLFLEDINLQLFYPNVMRTGDFNTTNLKNLIVLIKKGTLKSISALTLTYGRVTKHLKEDEIVAFCNELSEIDMVAKWVSLEIINMYTHGRTDYDFYIIKPLLKKLILTVSFKSENKSRRNDSYHWLKNVEKLLPTEGIEFATLLCQYLIQEVTINDIEYSDLRDKLHIAFYTSFKIYGNDIWPYIAQDMLNHKGIKKYRLISLLGSGKESIRKSNSIFTLLDPQLIIKWCNESDIALELVASTLTIFENQEGEKEVNKLLIMLLSFYGNNKKLIEQIHINYGNRFWSGSLIPYLQSDKLAISKLLEHENTHIKTWAVNFISNINSQIDYETKSEAEENMLHY